MINGWPRVAVATYVLMAIIKKRLGLEHSLYTILQILSIAIFEKKPISQVFSEHENINEDAHEANQLLLFDL